MKRTILTGLFFVALLTGIRAQRQLTEHTFAFDSTLSAPATLDDLSWLEGRWSGEGFGGSLEEIWSPPAGGAMVATFRMLSGDKPGFYEFCMIAEENGTLVYKVKHFNPDLRGWEEKDRYEAFHLVKIAPDAVYFDGLTMVRNGNACTLYLAMKQKDGTYQEAKLIYRKEEHRELPGIHIPQDAGNLARLREINQDVWMPFAEAYAANDAEKYLALHTPDFIRATGGDTPAVKDLAAYRISTQAHFNWTRENAVRAEIAFTFFERVAGEQTASERGTYRYTAISADGGRRHYYGRFHVFLRKTDGTWKIAVDYDSDEDGTTGPADFKAGLPPEVFARF